MWACFWTDSHTMPGCSIISLLGLRWIKGVCMFSCNLPPALLAEWLGSFTCHFGSRGVEWTPSKSQHAKLPLEKKIFSPLLLGFELTTFQSWVRRSNQQAAAAPDYKSCPNIGILSMQTLSEYRGSRVSLLFILCGILSVHWPAMTWHFHLVILSIRLSTRWGGGGLLPMYCSGV